MHRTLARLFLLLIASAWLSVADSIPSVTAPEPAPESVDEQPLPVYPEYVIPPAILDSELQSLRRARMFAGCRIAPLSEIEDPAAFEFEKNADTSPVDIDDLTPDAAQVLTTFQGLVATVGGSFQLKSAYRPLAYQAHLHEVWVKWVKQLRNNHSAGCRALREEVGAEFARHQLQLRQQPVPDSDHPLGLAFDAVVTMPRGARVNGKRVNVDKLAALAGAKRPTSRRDPAHFKVLTERPPAL